jgi:DNA polymerase-3 subunit delta
MKFQQWIQLQKFMKSSFSAGQGPRVYLVVHRQREERKNLLVEKIAQEISLFSRGATSRFLEADQIEWKDVHTTLCTPSLFGEEEIVIWDGVKEIPSSYAEYVLSPSKQAFFLVGMEAIPKGNGLLDLYKQTKQSFVLLDLSEEKPWEKQKRVQQEIVQLIKDAGKRMSPDALSLFFSSCGFEVLVLESELAKLFCYVGDRKEIGEKDVLAIVSKSSVATGWQVAEALVWGKTIPFSEASIDVTFLLGFLGQVRFYLQQGRQIGCYLEQNRVQDEILKAMPSLKSAQLQKIKEKLQGRRMEYFDQALLELYEMELLAKNSHLSPSSLFDLVQIKLTHLKEKEL